MESPADAFRRSQRLWGTEGGETPEGVEVGEVRVRAEEQKVGPRMVARPRQARVAREAKREAVMVFPCV